jgi:hypothetical protein
MEASTGGLKVFLADDAAGSSAMRERIREEILRRLDISILKQVFVALSAKRHSSGLLHDHVWSENRVSTSINSIFWAKFLYKSIDIKFKLIFVVRTI